MKPLLIDLYCGAGGAAHGYHQAGFDIIGIDINPQPNYPYPFAQGDALNPPLDLTQADAIHASPPCQAYSIATLNHRTTNTYPDLVAPTRQLLETTGLPWIIENVPGAPLHNHIQICGSGLAMTRIRRHRWFESNTPLWGIPCVHGQNTDVLSIVGHSEGSGKAGPGYLKPARETAMGIDWMTNTELSQAIPPAYTHHIGTQLLQHLT